MCKVDGRGEAKEIMRSSTGTMEFASGKITAGPADVDVSCVEHLKRFHDSYYASGNSCCDAENN